MGTFFHFIINKSPKMCVDDYEFRHYSAKRQKLCRRFIFKTTEGHQRTFLINISQFQRFGQLCLCQILLHLSKKGLNVKDYSFYMPDYDITIQAGDKCKVPFDILVGKQVIFQMRLIESQTINQNYQSLYINPLDKKFFNFNQEQKLQPCHQCNGTNQCPTSQSTLIKISQKSFEDIKIVQQEEKISKQPEVIQQMYIPSYNITIRKVQSNEGKKHKEQEKTIQQAIIKTKLWRLLHEKCNYSLKNAAIFIQLSKKTLDDYFLVLRVGESHGYNFTTNLNKKIGHLRAFIRNQPVKVTGRLSKQVRCFNIVPDPDLTQYCAIQNWDKVQHISEELGDNRSESNNKIDPNEMISE